MYSFGERVFLFGITGFLATVTLASACVIASVIWAPELCAARWEPKETEWSWLTNCRVKVNGEFVPENNVRMIDGVP